MKLIRRTFGLFLIIMATLSVVFQSARAQSDEPLVLVMTAEGPIVPPMFEYIQRGVNTAEQRNADLLIIQLDTFGGSLDSMKNIVQTIRESSVPVVVYVSPSG